MSSSIEWLWVLPYSQLPCQRFSRLAAQALQQQLLQT
jgi:hypothetical protein